MITRRVVYILTLVSAILFYILYSYWFSWYLLVFLVVLIPFDLLISLPGMLTRRLNLAAPMVLDQGGDGTLKVTTLQSGPFPLRCIKARVQISCEEFSVQRHIMCGAEHGCAYEITIDTSRTGVTSFDIRRFWAISLIGLFSIPLPASCKAAVLILPAPARPPNTISLPRSATLRPKPGGGFSEEHDLRPYRPGDPIKSIHWKVSAKHDSLVVRDPLVPQLHSRLVHIMKWGQPRERDAILGRLMWISGYLLGLDLYYYIRLGENQPVAEITKERDLEVYLFHVLSGTQHLLPSPPPLPARFTWEYRVDASEGAK